MGRCLDPHDLAFSKPAARREKNLAFVALLQHKLIRPSTIERLSGGVAGAALRSRLGEAWPWCRRRAAEWPATAGGDD